MVTYGLFGIVSPLVSSARLSNVTNTLGGFVTWSARPSGGFNPILVMGVVSAGFIVDLSLSVSSRDRSCVGLMLLFPGLLKSSQLVDKLATFWGGFGFGVLRLSGVVFLASSVDFWFCGVVSGTYIVEFSDFFIRFSSVWFLSISNKWSPSFFQISSFSSIYCTIQFSISQLSSSCFFFFNLLLLSLSFVLSLSSLCSSFLFLSSIFSSTLLSLSSNSCIGCISSNSFKFFFLGFPSLHLQRFSF